MSIRPIGKTSFGAEVLESSGPVLVEFWAPWCGYCQRLAPVLDGFAKKMGDKLPIRTVNVDLEPELEDRYDVELIPTLFLFRNGKHGGGLVAPQTEEEIELWLGTQK